MRYIVHCFPSRAIRFILLAQCTRTHAHPFPHLDKHFWMRVSRKCSNNFYLAYEEPGRENCEHCHATGHNINPHNVTVLSDENNIIERHVKKAIAIKQKKNLCKQRRAWTGPPGHFQFYFGNTQLCSVALNTYLTAFTICHVKNVALKLMASF